MNSAFASPTPFNPEAGCRLLRLQEVLRRTGFSRPTLFREIDKGNFMRPVRLSANINAWPEGEVDAWIAARLAERDVAQAPRPMPNSRHRGRPKKPS